MNGFELTADLVDSAAWPVCVGFIIWLYRDEIRTLLDLLGRARKDDS